MSSMSYMGKALGILLYFLFILFLLILTQVYFFPIDLQRKWKGVREKHDMREMYPLVASTCSQTRGRG